MEGTTVSASALAFAEFRLQGGGHGEEGSDGVMDSRSPQGAATVLRVFQAPCREPQRGRQGSCTAEQRGHAHRGHPGRPSNGGQAEG